MRKITLPKVFTLFILLLLAGSQNAIATEKNSGLCSRGIHSLVKVYNYNKEIYEFGKEKGVLKAAKRVRIETAYGLKKGMNRGLKKAANFTFMKTKKEIKEEEREQKKTLFAMTKKFLNRLWTGSVSYVGLTFNSTKFLLRGHKLKTQKAMAESFVKNFERNPEEAVRFGLKDLQRELSKESARFPYVNRRFNHVKTALSQIDENKGPLAEGELKEIYNDVFESAKKWIEDYQQQNNPEIYELTDENNLNILADNKFDNTRFHIAHMVYQSLNNTKGTRVLSKYIDFNTDTKTVSLKFNSDIDKIPLRIQKIADLTDKPKEWFDFLMKQNVTLNEASIIHAQISKHIKKDINDPTSERIYKSYIKYALSYSKSKAPDVLDHMHLLKINREQRDFEMEDEVNRKFDPVFKEFWVDKAKGTFDFIKLHFTQDNFIIRRYFPTRYNPEYISRFEAQMEKVDKYQYQTAKRVFKFMENTGFQRNGKKLSPREAYDIAKRSSTIHKNYYENLHFGCRSQRRTEEHANGLDSFKTYLMAVGFIATGVGYTANNWEAEKNTDWLLKLGYEFAMIWFITKVLGEIFANPASSKWAKMGFTYSFNTVVDHYSSKLYEFAFGVKNDELEKKIERLKRSVNFDEEVKELLQSISRLGLEEEFMKAYASTRGVLDIKKRQPKSNLLKYLDPIPNMTKEDLENENVRELLSQVIAYQIKKQEINNQYLEYIKINENKKYLGIPDEVINQAYKEVKKSDDLNNVLAKLLEPIKGTKFFDRIVFAVNEHRLTQIDLIDGEGLQIANEVDNIKLVKEDLDNLAIAELLKYILAQKEVKKKQLEDPMKYQQDMATSVLAGMYNVDKETMDLMVKKLLDDPRYRLQLEDLKNLSEEIGLQDKLENEIRTSNVFKIASDYTGEVITPKEWKHDIKGISKEDLNNKELEDIFIKGLTRQFYEGQAGQWIRTGSIADDRFWYGRLWTVWTTPKKVILAGIIYQLLCTAGTRKTESVMMALMITLVDKFFSENWYFMCRNKAVGQNPDGNSVDTSGCLDFADQEMKTFFDWIKVNEQVPTK